MCILNCANRWIQQLDGLYPLQYFFWTKVGCCETVSVAKTVTSTSTMDFRA
jgi:hypothetical protein